MGRLLLRSRCETSSQERRKCANTSFFSVSISSFDHPPISTYNGRSQKHTTQHQFTRPEKAKPYSTAVTKTTTIFHHSTDPTNLSLHRILHSPHTLGDAMVEQIPTRILHICGRTPPQHLHLRPLMVQDIVQQDPPQRFNLIRGPAYTPCVCKVRMRRRYTRRDKEEQRDSSRPLFPRIERVHSRTTAT